MKSQQGYTFKQFNEEINDFYKYLKDNRYSDEDIRKIFTPLKPADLKPTRLTTITILALLTIIAVLYLTTYIETISWYLSAFGRIVLINLIPFWDWPSLKNSKCLIEKPTFSSIVEEENSFNCDLCESIQAIEIYDVISGDYLKTRYLDVDVPVIVEQTFQKSDTLIADLIDNPTLARSQPCRLSTNVVKDVQNLKSLLYKTEIFESFFLHFQNCDFSAVKQFRGLAPRPRFLPNDLSPVQYNWLLWSRDYNVTQSKEIGLVEKVAVVGQILGANFFKLIPRQNCAEKCPVFEVRLKEGECLILTSLWDLEYRPDSGENLAVILEMH